MAIQTATTGQLENAQNTIIAKARYTQEHNMPVVQLFEKFSLPKGAKTITVPKVGQATFSGLTDGVDMVDTQDIGMTTVDLSTAEVGAKFILTDKLVRQESEDVFSIVGRQLGDGLARKKDTDAIALFSGFSGALGADDKGLIVVNLLACIGYAKANKFPSPLRVVHHPNAIFDTMRSSSVVASIASGAGTPTYNLGPLPSDPDAGKYLKNFYKFSFNGADIFEDGNIAVIGSTDSGYGAIFSPGAAAYVESVGFSSAKERDESLRATEIVVVADYSLTELDDAYGASMRYEIGAPATNL